MDVTLPDGTVLEGVPDGTTKAQLAQKLKSNGREVPAEWMQAPKPDPVKTAINKSATAGLVDAGLALGSGAVAGPVSGLAGLAGSVLPGPEGQGAEWVKKTQDALTYKPKTTKGEAITSAASYPFVKLSELGDYVGGNVTDTRGPLAGAAANTTLQTIPTLLLPGARGATGRLLTKAENAAMDKASVNSVRDMTLADARKEGFVVPGSAVDGGSFTGNRLESLAGKAATKQDASIRNQIAADAVGRREAGLPANAPLSRDSLRQAREEMAQPYREVAAFAADSPLNKPPFKSPAETLQELKEVRTDATSYWQHYNRSADPKSLKEAKRLDAKAELLEDSIEAVATGLGKPDLVDRLRAARTALAKNFDVEKALNVGDGHVDPRIWGSMLDKKKKLSGGLETAGRFAEAFGDYVQPGAMNKGPGISKVEAALGAVLGSSGYAAAGPLGIAAAGLPLLSHPARSLVLSKFMQKEPSYGPSKMLRLADLAARDPVYSSIPLSEIPQGQRR